MPGPLSKSQSLEYGYSDARPFKKASRLNMVTVMPGPSSKNQSLEHGFSDARPIKQEPVA